jgi:N-acetylglutamate synthase-like GNAT family acetyltransferase|tara:strand:- start:739 stop:1191 length:453 start_codon:yes stop_codon:yes gene_type:complete
MENQEQHQINVRLAKADDLNRICEIYSQHFGYTEAPSRQWWNILDDNSITYIVVEADRRVIGVASMITINKLIRSGNRIALIEDVAVDKSATGTGAGKLLINYLKDLAVEKNCYKTILNCSKKNVGFYEKLGFHKKEIQMRWDRPQRKQM